MPNLTATQLATLNNFIVANDRFNYWSTLATYGDPYAKLALGVVTNETYSGQIANNHLMTTARESGVDLNANKLREIGTRLMQADFGLRKELVGKEITLSASDIMTYHTRVFRDEKLPAHAWTAYKILQDALRGGGEAKMNAVWNQMLSGDPVWIRWATGGDTESSGCHIRWLKRRQLR